MVQVEVPRPQRQTWRSAIQVRAQMRFPWVIDHAPTRASRCARRGMPRDAENAWETSCLAPPLSF